MHAFSTYVKAFLFAAALLGGAYLQRNWSIHSIAEDAIFMEPAVSRRVMRIFRTGAPPARGTIVWFESTAVPGHMLVSRTVGVAGDRIALDDGRLVRNGA